MSNTTTIESSHGTAFFTRKVCPRQYESAEAGIYIPFDLPSDPDLSAEAYGVQLQAAARDAFFQAKALVFEELGIEFSVEEGGAIVELVKQVFPGTEVQGAPANVTPTASAPSAQAAASSDVPPAPPYDPNTRDKDQKAANKAWGQARLAAFPNEFYDNRPKKADGSYKSTAPDFKHKDSGLGIWSS